MTAAWTDSGLSALGDVRWGSHFCHFYRTGEDLAETLVPFFQAGLERNERCLWVTSAPLAAREARERLAAAVPDLARRVERGQIEILDHDQWYQRAGSTDTDGALRGWVQREADALAQGYAGLRLTGNTAWLERSGWQGFMDYEARVSGTFAPRRIVGLCSYSVERCGADEVLDVVRHHDFALSRRGGKWEVVESQALAAAKAELARANADLEGRVRDRTSALEAALRARDEFLAVASHELRTPLTALQLALGTAVRAHERDGGAADQATRLGRAVQQTQRLSALVDELLDVSRARSGELRLAPCPMDAAALAADVAERMREPLARAGCALELDAPAPVEGRWDAARLEQVLVNLLANAARHAPRAPVTLAVRRGEDGGAVLVVRDRGPGVPPDARERIFDPFTRLPPQHGGGFGLGLWLVARIVEAHGGTVRVDDAEGGGAMFVVTLPPAAPEGREAVAVVPGPASA